MDTSIFLAKVFGFGFVVLGLSMFFNIKRLKMVIDDIVKSPGLMYVTGFFTFVLGLIMVIAHNVWVGWPVVVTVLAWLTLLKGAMFVGLPNYQTKLIKAFRMDKWYTVGSIFVLALGAYLLYAVYYMV